MSPEELIEIIKSVLPLDKTDAIYVFGSFGTELFDEDSDIDIGWFVSTKLDLIEPYNLEDKLSKVLKRPVDLVVVEEWVPNLLTSQIIKSKINYLHTEKFAAWLGINIDCVNLFVVNRYGRLFGESYDYNSLDLLRLRFLNMLDFHTDINSAFNIFMNNLDDAGIRLFSEKSLRASISGYRELIIYFCKELLSSSPHYSSISEPFYLTNVRLFFKNGRCNPSFVDFLCEYSEFSNHAEDSPTMDHLIYFIRMFDKEMILLESGILRVINDKDSLCVLAKSKIW